MKTNNNQQNQDHNQKQLPTDKNYINSDKQSHKQIRLTCKQCIEHISQTNTTYRQRQALQTWLITKQPNKYLGQQDHICTKYNTCYQPYNKNDKPRQLQFDIPKQLLQQESQLDYCREIAVLPQPEHNSNKVQLSNQRIQVIDQFIKHNIRQNCRKQAQQRKQSQQKQKQRKASLDKLNKSAKLLLEKDVQKRQLLQKEGAVPLIRPKWGHSIYNDQDQIQNQATKHEHGKNQSASKQMKLQPIQQRLQTYQLKMKQLQEAKKQQLMCRHRHTNHAKDLVQIQAQIEQSALAILAEKRRKRKALKQQRLIISGKIRAIQLQSKQHVSKCKKKPVDPNIEFIVDVVHQHQPKNKKTKTTKAGVMRELSTTQALQQQNKKKQHINSNVSKMKDYSNKLRQTQKSKKSINSQSSQSQQIGCKLVNTQQLQQMPSKTGGLHQKFYIWNVPVNMEDIAKLEQDYYDDRVKSKKKEGSFRDEVNEYLIEKRHGRLQQDIVVQKNTAFNEQVAKKKAQYLEQYAMVHEWGDYAQQQQQQQQVFWDEEQVHRYHPIANYRNY